MLNKFPCDYCTKSFLEVGSLKVHRRKNACEELFHVTSAQVIFKVGTLEDDDDIVD